MTLHLGYIDLVAVNLYPFRTTVAGGADFATCIENIDIGGRAEWGGRGGGVTLLARLLISSRPKGKSRCVLFSSQLKPPP